MLAVLDEKDWFYMEYISDMESLCVASYNGLIVMVDLNNGDVKEFGSMEDGGGIKAMSWSAGTEMVAILTNNDMLLTLSNEADVLMEVPLLTPLIPMYTASIIWRADGKYLIINGVWEESEGCEKGERYIHVFTSTTLEQVYVGRNEDGSTVNGIDTVMAWSTNGSLICICIFSLYQILSLSL